MHSGVIKLVSNMENKEIPSTPGYKYVLGYFEKDTA
jgi:hypothetical protein